MRPLRYVQLTALGLFDRAFHCPCVELVSAPYCAWTWYSSSDFRNNRRRGCFALCAQSGSIFVRSDATLERSNYLQHRDLMILEPPQPQSKFQAQARPVAKHDEEHLDIPLEVKHMSCCCAFERHLKTLDSLVSSKAPAEHNHALLCYLSRLSLDLLVRSPATRDSILHTRYCLSVALGLCTEDR